MAKAQIGVRELKDELSATLARVRRGEAITVTDRNRPVAIIVPARAAEEAQVREGDGRDTGPAAPRAEARSDFGSCVNFGGLSRRQPQLHRRQSLTCD